MNVLDLVNKLESVEVQITDKFPQDDMEFCRQEEQKYQAAYNLYSEFSFIAAETNKVLYALPENVYVQSVDGSTDKLIACNNRFISNICSYFRDKYRVSIDYPEWATVTENDYGRKISEDKMEPVPLQHILDSIYEQMGGMSFEEKAFDEIKAEARRAVTKYSGQSQYIIKGVKLIITDFYCSYKDRIWQRYKARVEDHHRAFFKALSHFEYGTFDIAQKYQFLFSRWEIDEDNGVYDKHYLHSTVIESIKIFKNGKVEFEFKDYQTAVRFMDTYFPGLPQQQAAA